MKKGLQKIKYFLDKLSSRPTVGGLFISDSALQYLVIDGGSIKPFIIKLPFGVVRLGRIVDEKKFSEALSQLHKLLTHDEKTPIPVTAILPSSGIYTQSFSVPNIGVDKLNEAANLNIQMISPMSVEHSYMSWEVIGETQDQFELLGAFADKAIIEDMRRVLEGSHFSCVAFEFPSLSLARLISLSNMTTEKPAILISISSDGMNLSIIRNKGLCFDSFKSWLIIQGDKKEITKDYFESVVAEELQRVINFSLSKFRESPERVFLVTPGFEEGLQKFIQPRFNLPTVLLSIPSWGIPSSWYAVVGAALRENVERDYGEQINLLPSGVSDFFVQEQTIRFVYLWREIIVSVLGVLFLFFAGSAYIVGNELIKAKGHLAIFTANLPKDELLKLEGDVKTFNSLVESVSKAEGGMREWSELFEKILNATKQKNIKIDKIDAISFGEPVVMYARGPDTNTIVDFKNILTKDSSFSNIDLLVSQITAREDGTFGFQISFRFSPQAKKPLKK